MFGNLSVVEMFKRLTSKHARPPEDLPTFYDLYNEHDQRPWEVVVDPLDKKKIEFAISHMRAVPISPNLDDVQLLKLHATSFPEYDNQLVYHAMFDLYEVKYNKRTTHIFAYRDGRYTPVSNIM